MAVLLCLYLTTLAGIILPPIIDKLLFKKEVASVKRRVAAYAAMTLIYVISSLLIQHSMSEITIPIVAVVVACFIDRVTFISTAFVFFVTSIFAPLFIVYQVALANGVKDIPWMLQRLEWTLIVPFLSAMITFFVFRFLSKAKSSNENARGGR